MWRLCKPFGIPDSGKASGNQSASQSQTTAPGTASQTLPHIACDAKRSGLGGQRQLFRWKEMYFCPWGFIVGLKMLLIPELTDVEAARQALVTENIPLPSAPNFLRHLWVDTGSETVVGVVVARAFWQVQVLMFNQGNSLVMAVASNFWFALQEFAG